MSDTALQPTHDLLNAPAEGVVLTMRQVTGAEWDHLQPSFDEACQEQLYVFAKTRWPRVGQEPVVFSLDGQIVGGTLVMIQKLPLGIGAIAVCKWGPMLTQADHPDALAIYRAMVDLLVAEYADRRRLMLSVLPRASLTPHNLQSQYLRDRGFSDSAKLMFPNRYIVDLRLSDEDQRKSFEQKWRYHLNKSFKASLTFEHATPADLPVFEKLYTAMTDRKQFADHSAYDTLPALMAIADDALRPELFFVRLDGEAIAGAVIFKTGDRAVYLYGATNDKALPLRTGYFMHWHIILWLRDNTRARWYDLGGTDGYQGLHQFKKGMVGQTGIIEPVPPVANFASSPIAKLVGNGAFKARDLMHHSIRLLGQLRTPKQKPSQPRHVTAPSNADAPSQTL